MIPEFKIVAKKDLTDSDRKIFAELLQKQGKVKGNLLLKADRCKEICIAYIVNIPVAIGGIKIKTESDFHKEKADLTELAKDFEWELGYIYTDENHNGKGLSSSIIEKLLEKNKKENLMASTEIITNPIMVHLLEKNNFVRKGKSWQSGIHHDELGLFLRKKLI